MVAKMFHSAAIKLTLWYLAIIMAISLIFSITLYHVSGEELGRNVNRQIGYFNNLIGPDETINYQALRNRQLNEDLGHLKANLFLFNLLVLASGGAASYWLARRTLEPIEQALESQTRFASDASHELRTPLTAIQTENEVALRSKNLSKTQAVALLNSNLEEVGKLKSLAEGLLRLANGSGLLNHVEAVPINEPAGQAVERHLKGAQAKKIRIIDQTTNLKVLGDRDSLVELISVFIDNAIKYSRPGSKVVLTTSKRNKQILLKISDNGSGINKQDLPHIFERFYRTDASRSRPDSGGYGLGLAIAKKITEAHHGYIEVNSTVGKGSAFSVYLPAA
jgi:two-component system, OmpR family, sensor histidine kinase CiaH